MFVAQNIRDWRGRTVFDPDGDKIGELEGVYVDTASDEPIFATVKIGMVGRHRLAFVPLTGTVVGPTWIKVAEKKNQVKDAPAIDTDGGLPADDEERVFSHYGLAYEQGASGERRLARR